MVTNAGRLRWFWDDELEQLTSQAAAPHSNETVSDAVNHALRELIANKRVPVSFSDLKAAMKAELRRLVRPN